MNVATTTTPRALGAPTEPLLPYGRHSIDESDVIAVVRALTGEMLTQGPTVARFEEAIAERCGARYCVAVASGTAALHLASLASGVRAGDGGVTSDVTFVASANGIRYAGGDVALADVDPLTGLASPAALEEALDRLVRRGVTPKVIVPVDYAGQLADLPAIAAIAKRRGVRVIEDAAHSLGARYRHDGRSHRAGSCAHSDFAILSFHPVKHITTLEGGAVLTNDEGACRELMALRSHGIARDPAQLSRCDGPWYYEQQALGFHYRISDVACALGLSQLGKLETFLKARRARARRYDVGLVERGLTTLCQPLGRAPLPSRSAHHLYVVRLTERDGEIVEDVAARRLALYHHLKARRIAAQVHYVPVHRHPDFHRFVDADQRFSGAERFYAGCLSLPLFPTMTDGDVDRVLDALGSFEG